VTDLAPLEIPRISQIRCLTVNDGFLFSIRDLAERRNQRRGTRHSARLSWQHNSPRRYRMKQFVDLSAESVGRMAARWSFGNAFSEASLGCPMAVAAIAVFPPRSCRASQRGQTGETQDGKGYRLTRIFPWPVMPAGCEAPLGVV
jgi:hypothetical protein